MTSYAQNHEDVLLNRVFPEPLGFYIDVGAAHPIEDSVTKWFYDRGWSGINIEPQTGYYEALTADRPRDVNLNVALGSVAGVLTLHEAPDFPGWTTMAPTVADGYRDRGFELRAREVRVQTLAEVCERYVRGPIDFLKIDVEGYEPEVLRGADFTRWRPRILVVEATEVGGPALNYEHWEPIVLAADYHYATFDGLNRYYVRAEDRGLAERLQVPVNLFDEATPYKYLWRIKGLERQLIESQGRAADREALGEKVEKLSSALDWQTKHAETLLRDLEWVKARSGDLERLADAARGRQADLQQAGEVACRRVAELEQELDQVRAALESLRRQTVSKSAYEAALALLDRTRADLDALRAEIVDRVLSAPRRE